MQALSPFLGLESLESIIDCSPLMVVPETPLSDAIALMATQSKDVLVGSSSHLVGCFTKRDIVDLIASGTDLRTAKISEVMHTSVKTLKVSEFPEMTCNLSLLCQQHLDLLPVVDNQGQVIGVITPESICQALAQEIETTTNNYEETEEKRGNFVGYIDSYLDITESKQAFEVLPENGTQKRLTLVPTHTIYWEQNLNQDLMLFLSILGEPGETQEISYSKFLELVHPGDREKFASTYSEAIANSSSFEIEHRIFLEGRCSEYKWLLTRAIVRKDTTGKPARLIGVSVDITSCVQAKEEQLRLLQQIMDTIPQCVFWKDRNSVLLGCNRKFIKIAGFDQAKNEASNHSESRFRNLVEVSSDWVWEVDENTVYTYVSPKIRDILGYEPTEVLGKTPFEFMSAAEAKRVIKIFAPIAAAQQPFKCLESINIHQDGHLVVLETSGVPIFDDKGQFRGYRGIDRDITGRKQTETALLVSQQKLQYLLSSSPAIIYTCNISGDFNTTFVSENVVSMTGYKAEKFIENSNFWASHIHPEDITQVFAEISNILTQGYYTIEYRFLHQDGIYRWIYDQGKIVRDQSGNPVEIVGYWANITERKHLEQELRVALEKEKQLSELKSRFVSMTSHEFRTPLSTILSSCELLEHYRHKWTEEKQLTHLHRIQTAVKRMTEMLNDVLVIGKAGTGKLNYRPTSFDLVKFCEQLLDEIQMNLNNQRLISFTSQYEFVSCCMDEKLLGHILNNLLSNAIKYSPDDSIIKFSLSCKNGQAIFEIQDWGIGIPQEDLPYLFESFHRASNVGNILGTGLGMSIVKKCVDIHKGEIFVKSTVGLGTSFTVILSLNNKI
ncbi:PAS domain-containing protein [Nostoc sp. C117]|uniref:PAS domain-containing protein n=1 Tax=Nostoc sp. C117 TaxID=3349875 RepID=UPI00370D2050